MADKKINLQEIKCGINKIIDMMIERGKMEVILNQDYYTVININDAIKMKKNDVVVGSLYEDLEILKDIIESDDYPLAVDLENIAQLLRYISINGDIYK